MFKYFDIHGHTNFSEYDSDRESVISRALEKGVGLISVGTDIASSKKAIESSNAHENEWACIGFHPANGQEDGFFDLDIYKELAKNKKVVGIGECGLDFFHRDESYRKTEVDIFIEQIQLANEINKPLMLHVRNGKGVNAYKEALEILSSHAKVSFNFHFFAGNIEDLKSILEKGGSVSFTGVISFTHDYDDLVRYAPKDRVMSETDCPYVAPHPYRGKRNEPVYVIEVVRSISRLWDMSEADTAKILAQNAVNFWSL
jgi:TatD DNase family protein